MSDEPRFFVDKRYGIVAVRDRTLTDPEYPGLHPDTEGVVWSRMWTSIPKTCPHCGTVKYEFILNTADVEEAHRVAAEMNTRPAAGGGT